MNRNWEAIRAHPDLDLVKKVVSLDLRYQHAEAHNLANLYPQLFRRSIVDEGPVPLSILRRIGGAMRKIDDLLDDVIPWVSWGFTPSWMAHWYVGQATIGFHQLNLRRTQMFGQPIDLLGAKLVVVEIDYDHTISRLVSRDQIDLAS